MPKPESSFFYRRIFTYASAAVTLGLVGWIIESLDDPAQLGRIGFWLLVLHFFHCTYYMIAPTAEQLAAIIKAGNPIKGDE